MNTLSLGDSLLQRGQQLLRWHQPRAAKRYLAPLLALNHPQYSFHAHRALAEWADEQQFLRRARWHWRAAWKLQPQNADVCYRYALALEADGLVPVQRAWAMIRRALRHDRSVARYWVLYGHVAQRLGRDRVALRAFRRAAQMPELAPTLLVETLIGLRTLGQRDEAQQRLIEARFQSPHDEQLQRLWDDWSWQDAQATQRAADEPTLLPFPTDRVATGPRLRHDAHSIAQPHLFRLPHEYRPKYRGS